MRKEFTFKSYFRYVLRNWLILAICAVIGLACGIGVGILTRKKQAYAYQGNICIAGVSKLDGLVDKPEDLYPVIKNDTFDTMKSEMVGNYTYNLLEAEWRNLPGNEKFTTSQARKKFNEQLEVSSSGPFLYVKFNITQEKNLNEYKQFGNKAVNTYLETAKTEAEKREDLLKDKEMLTVTAAVEQIPDDVESVGILKGGVIGVLGGAVVALVLIVIIYFADKRVLSYADIADVTGRRLIAVNKGLAANNVCPGIDAATSGATVVAVCGEEASCGNLARLLGEYAASVGHKTLRLDFCRGAYGDDTFYKFVNGEKTENCVTKENGTDILHGERSWAYLLSAKQKIDELKKIYNKIIISAPYTGDGSLCVVAKAADKTVFAVNQKKMSVNSVLGMAQEADSGDKAIGAVIDCIGKSFVGADTYVFVPEEE